jgi:hypothetical protein
MLSVAKYSPEHVERARARIDADVAAFAAVAKAADGGAAALEPVFFNNMVLALDHYFLHRARGQEGKNGNALNEVRVLCNSITDNGGVLLADKTIKMTPEQSVLGYAPGDAVAVGAEGFDRLAARFFEEIESRY